MRTRGISRKAIDPSPLMRLSWRYSSWVSGCSRRGMSYRPRPRQSTTLVLLLQLHSFGQACEKDRRERRAHTSTTVERGGHSVGLDIHNYASVFAAKYEILHIYFESLKLLFLTLNEDVISLNTWNYLLHYCIHSHHSLQLTS